MNKDQVKGAVNDAAGRAKRQVGEWTGDGNKQVEGAAQQVKGKAQKFVGNVKDAVREGSAHVDREREQEKGREQERERQRESEHHAHHG